MSGCFSHGYYNADVDGRNCELYLSTTSLGEMMTEKPLAKLVLRDLDTLDDKEAYKLVNWLRDKAVDVLFQRKQFAKVVTMTFSK